MTTPYKDLIASGPGAPHTFVTTETFLVTFDLQSLRDLPELELVATDVPDREPALKAGE